MERAALPVTAHWQRLHRQTPLHTRCASALWVRMRCLGRLQWQATRLHPTRRHPASGQTCSQGSSSSSGSRGASSSSTLHPREPVWARLLAG